MMTDSEVLKVLAELRTGEIVVFTMNAVREWPQLSPSPLNFQLSGGGMGFASSIGLGLALARPDKRVIVVDGDGSLLMNLGTLVTIANQSPPNLLHLVIENGLYEMPGRVPIPGAGKISMCGIAKSSGLAKSYEIDDLPDFREQLPRFLADPGPTLVCLKVVCGPKLPFTQASARTLAREMEKALRET